MDLRTKANDASTSLVGEGKSLQQRQGALLADDEHAGEAADPRGDRAAGHHAGQQADADPGGVGGVDRIDQIVTEHLEGLVVRKDLADKFRGRFSVPTYVGEFLIGKYCATSDEDEIQEGLEQVERLLSRRVVRTGEHELFKARVREVGAVQVIDIIRAKTGPAARRVHRRAAQPADQRRGDLGSRLVIDNDRMLTGGFYAQVGLTYVPGQPRPFVVTEVRPIQAHARAGLDRLAEARALLSTQEWKDFLLRSVGLEPAALSSEAQNAYFLRMVPFVVRNYNMVELGPRGTGKSHLFQQVSPYAYLLSGGQTTVAQLFVNNATGQRGLVTQHDVIAFDEIAGIRFRDRDGINVMKGYMASGEFARGRESIRAEGGMAFLGNFEVDVAHQLQRGHLLSPMPEVMRNDTAFMDRLHAYVPGWDIPAVGRDQKTHHYGLVSDLLAQWWHELRSENRYVRVRERIRHNDSWRGRDNEAVEKTVDGLLKLLYPDPEATVLPDDLAWAMELATVSRRRVKEAQASIGEEEFGAVNLGYSVDGGAVATPECPEQRVDWRWPSTRSSPASARWRSHRRNGLPDILPDPLPPGFPLSRLRDCRGPALGGTGRVRDDLPDQARVRRTHPRWQTLPQGCPGTVRRHRRPGPARGGQVARGPHTPEHRAGARAHQGHQSGRMDGGLGMDRGDSPRDVHLWRQGDARATTPPRRYPVARGDPLPGV